MTEYGLVLVLLHPLSAATPSEPKATPPEPKAAPPERSGDP
jgi:hypothetical protein